MIRLALQRFGRRLVDTVPLTARGFLVVALATLALRFYAYGALDLVVFCVAGAGLLLVLVCMLAVSVGAIALRRRLEAEPAAATLGTLESGVPLRTGFSVPSPERFPLIQIDWEWTEPADVECRVRSVGRWEEEVTARARTETSVVRRRFRVADAFGLANIAWTRDESVELRVLPEVRSLRRAAVVRSLAAAEGQAHPAGAPEGDRMEIRRYVAGDSVRHILWKTYARTGQLNVRLPERSVDRSKRTIAYLVSAPDDEPAAAAARVSLERGALGDAWTFGADGTPEPCETLEAGLCAIARSGSPPVRAAGAGAGLANFLGSVGGGGVDCVVFAPARPGPWIAAALGAARSTGTGVSFVLGTDGVLQASSESPLWERLLFANDDETGTSAAELATALREIGAGGSRALIVDRTTGRSFDAEHQRAMRLSA